MSEAVDAYLARLPEGQRAALEALRRTIRSVAPDAEETIRTRVPAFRHRGRPLVSMGAAKGHVALYLMHGEVLKAHELELRAFDATSKAIRFSPERPLPPGLVVTLVRARMAEIERAATVGPRTAAPAPRR